MKQLKVQYVRILDNNIQKYQQNASNCFDVTPKMYLWCDEYFLKLTC